MYLKSGSAKLLIIIIFLCAIRAYAQYDYNYPPPIEKNDGLEVASLLEFTTDTTNLFKLLHQLKEHENHLHSMLFFKDGQLLLEEYFNGQKPEEVHDLRSVTKSIRALLVGIAIDKGFIKSVDDSIEKYFGTVYSEVDWSVKRKITIENLLTMSSGLDCNDWNKKSKGQEDRVHKKKDWITYTLQLPLVNEPGTVSNYCSMGTVLLAEIIRIASGMEIDEFAQKYLFEPLGIIHQKWGHTSSKEVITSGKRLYLRSRDLAKLGLLVANQGNWKGNQLVSSNWIMEATTSKTKITNLDYGYLWWSIPLQSNGNILVSKTATGNGGQYIFIIPDNDLVVIFTGDAYNLPEDKLPFTIMQKAILPLF
ncbi:serine hydrolase [Cytophaga sp. FL35]|uniref:serine hydrolase domain-containing protein n=1 Tax=Cytophaga sp. FL35 TaxID=1904456 RepID=UPI0016539846|nr:serine hydrolase [Cytophaga sp. FL35]MBC6998608.1 serine hydrolase [Cytophaga sp. FL35]